MASKPNLKHHCGTLENSVVLEFFKLRNINDTILLCIELW